MNIKLSAKVLKRLKIVRKLIRKSKTEGKHFKKFKSKCKTIPGLVQQIVQNEVGVWEWRFDEERRKFRREKIENSKKFKKVKKRLKKKRKK